MSFPDLTPLLQRTDVLLAGLALTALVLIWLARRVHRLAKSERPDDALANLAMLIGLGWSSEVIWEITQNQLHFPIGLTLLLFFVLESLLLLAMMRAKRHVREFGWPGRFGTTAWIVATSMSVVAMFASHSLAEAALRAAIPLLVTKQWWDGLVGGSAKRPESVSSWRWTPRRLLLALGAIEPGERDVETVNRERVTQHMTRLEFRRRQGSPRQKVRAAAKLARLSLTADDEMIADVRRRVDRADWFSPTQHEDVAVTSRESIKASAAASARARRVRHGKALRKVQVAHPRPMVVAAQAADPDPRTTQEIDDAICVMKATRPSLSQRRIAHLLRTSDTRVARALRRRQNPEPPPSVNGRKPELTGADR